MWNAVLSYLFRFHFVLPIFFLGFLSTEHWQEPKSGKKLRSNFTQTKPFHRTRIGTKNQSRRKNCYDAFVNSFVCVRRLFCHMFVWQIDVAATLSYYTQKHTVLMFDVVCHTRLMYTKIIHNEMVVVAGSCNTTYTYTQHTQSIRSNPKETVSILSARYLLVMAACLPMFTMDLGCGFFFRSLLNTLLWIWEY